MNFKPEEFYNNIYWYPLEQLCFLEMTGNK